MAIRMAGSPVDFTPQSLTAAASGGGYSAAANVVNINDSYKAQREKAPKYDELANQGIVNRSQEKQQAMASTAQTVGQGLASIGQAKSSALTAEGTIRAAKYQAEAAKQGAMMEAIGGIASAGLGLLSPIG